MSLVEERVLTDIDAIVSAIARELQAARNEGLIGVLAEFDGGVVVQWQVDPGNPGADGSPMMALEVVPVRRLGRKQRARLAEFGWEKPRGRSMPHWWRLIGDVAEAKVVAGQLVRSLIDVYEVGVGELLALVPDAPASPATSGPMAEDVAPLLTAVARDWNAAAARTGKLPTCEPEPEESYSGEFFCPLDTYPVSGTNICADLIHDGHGTCLRFTVDPEGSPDVSTSLSVLLPEGVVIQRDPATDVVYLGIRLARLDDVELLHAWEVGLKATMVAWAVALPVCDPIYWYDLDDEFPGSSLFGADDELSPEAEMLRSVITLAAAYLTVVDPPRNDCFVIGYVEAVPVPDIEMLMAVTNLRDGCDELIGILGLWLDALAPSESDAWAANTRRTPQQRFVDCVPGLGFQESPAGLMWSFHADSEYSSQGEALTRLGWQRTGQFAVYELPASVGWEEAGRTVGRTIVQVVGVPIREVFWKMLDIEQPETRLRQFIALGDV